MKVVVAYWGRPFHGWQRQPGQKTIQGEIERALSQLTSGNATTVVGSGRTDAGVHAAGQVVHVDLPSAIPPDGLKRGLNGILPREIRILSARSVSPSFHARKSALGKLYVYRGIWHEPTLPWSEPRAASIQRLQDERSFADAIELFNGRHDWASFTVPDPESESTTRTIFRTRLLPRRDGFELCFLGEGFLRYQVRRMVGALLEIGWGRRTIDELRDLIDSPTPGAPIQTAPAGGLCLERVHYRRSAAFDGGREKAVADIR